MSMPVLSLKSLITDNVFSAIRLTLQLKITMENEELINKLKAIVSPYVQDEEAFANLSAETDFVRDLKINSANLLDIILDIEEVFDIRLENEDMEKMLDVKTAMAIVNEKLAN